MKDSPQQRSFNPSTRIREIVPATVMRSRVFACTVGFVVSLVFAVGCTRDTKVTRHLERANEYFAKGALEEAKLEYANVLQLDAEHLRAHERLGLIWLEQGAPMRALPYLMKARAANPNDREVHFRVARLSLEIGKTPEARKEALALLQLAPGHPAALILLTELVRSPADFRTAQQELAKSKDRSSAAYQLAAANLMAYRWDWASARAALQRARALEPKSAAVHTALGHLLWRESGQAAAAAEFKRAAELSPARSIARIDYAGQLALTDGEPAATAYLKEVVKSAPDYLPAWRALASLAVAEKRFAEAQGYLQEILKRDPINYEGHVVQAQLKLAKGQVPEAIAEFQRLGHAFPGLPADKYQLAQAHLRNRDVPSAMAALKDAVAQNPDLEDAVLSLAELSLRHGDATAAANAMIDFLPRRPHVLRAQILLMQALHSLGRTNEFESSVRANIEKDPTAPQSHYVLGLVLERQGRPEDARRALLKALELAPDHQLVVTELVNLDLKEAKFAAALRRVDAQIAKTPKAAAAYFLKARVCAAENRWDDVEGALLRAWDVDDKYPGVYEMMVTAYLARKDRPDNVGRLERLVAARPNDLRALMLAGHLFLMLDQPLKAQEVYERFLAVRPDNGLVLNNLAVVHAEHLNDLQRGWELASKARTLSPHSPEVADTLGWILFRQEKYLEALELLKESAAKTPDIPETQYHLGRAGAKAGQWDLARAAFLRAAEAKHDFPGKGDIAQHLAEIEAARPNASR